MPPTPEVTGGWITGRFHGHYAADGVVRRGEAEVRTVRLLRGRLEEARFSPFGPPDLGPAVTQESLAELWVAAGTGEDGFPLWQPVPVRDVRLYEPEKGADELLGGTGLGELSGTLWARMGPQEARVGAIAPVPEAIPDSVEG